MSEQDSFRSASASEERASWSEDTARILPLLFERHPVVTSVIQRYGYIILFGYAFLAFLADIRQWQWFRQWLDLSAPITNGLRALLPFLDALTNAILANGFVASANAVGHVLTFSVTFSALIFAFGCAAIFSRNDEDWKRLNSAIPQRRLVQITVVNGLGFAVFVIAASIWLVAGDRYFEMDMLILHGMFYVSAVFGLGLLITVCAMRHSLSR